MCSKHNHAEAIIRTPLPLFQYGLHLNVNASKIQKGIERPSFVDCNVFKVGWPTPRVNWLYAGAVPLLVLMGVLIDNTCLMWKSSGRGEVQEQCGDDTGGLQSCWIYHSDRLAISLCVMMATAKALTATCLLMCWFLYKEPPPPSTASMAVNGVDDVADGAGAKQRRETRRECHMNGTVAEECETLML